MKKSKIKIGYWARTMWDDIGAMDGVVVAKSERWATVYFPADEATQMVDFSQFVSIGNRLEAKESGLK